MNVQIDLTLLAVLGSGFVTVAAFLWWAIGLTWKASGLNSQLQILRRDHDALMERVDEHDDLRIEMAQVKQGLHDTRSALQALQAAQQTSFGQIIAILTKRVTE
jgi:hypothetical protein